MYLHTYIYLHISCSIVMHNLRTLTSQHYFLLHKHTHYTNLFLKIPDMFSFRECDGRVRLYFLGVPSGRKDNTLMYCDVTNKGEANTWNQLLDVSEPQDTSVTSLSKVSKQMGYISHV